MRRYPPSRRRREAGFVGTSCRLLDSRFSGLFKAAAANERHTAAHGTDNPWRGAVQIRLPQCAVQPPSTGSATPVIEAAASLARNTATAPISSTVANFL